MSTQFPPGLPSANWSNLGIGVGAPASAPSSDAGSIDAARSLDFSGPAPGLISPSGGGPSNAQEGSKLLVGYLVKPRV